MSYLPYVIEKIEKYKGYTYVVMFRDMGHRNGYVLLPERLQYLIPEQSNNIDLGYINGHINYYGPIYFREVLKSNKEIESMSKMVGFSFDHLGDAVDFPTLEKYFPESEALILESGKHGTVTYIEDVEDICKNIIDKLENMLEALDKLASIIANICKTSNADNAETIINAIEAARAKIIVTEEKMDTRTMMDKIGDIIDRENTKIKKEDINGASD